MSVAQVVQLAGPYRSSSEMPALVSDVTSGLADLAEHGVAVHRGFISDEMADRLRDRLDEQAYMERKLGVGRVGDATGLSGEPNLGEEGDVRVAAAGDTSEPIYQVLTSLVNKGKVFRELMMNKNAHAYAEGVMRGEPWTLWGMNGIITRRGSGEQFLHTDSSTVPHDMLTRPVMINCFICVSDFDLDMGPTAFIPGSHRGPRPRYDGDEKAPRAVMAAPKGSAIIWDGSTWHGQSAHNSDKTRYSIAMSYCLFAIRQGENYAASVQDAIYEQLTLEEKKLLGFQTCMVGAMNAFGPRNATDKHHGIGSTTHFVPELVRD